MNKTNSIPWEEASEEIETRQIENGFTLNSSELTPLTNAEHEKIALLFDMAEREIANPSTSLEYKSLEDISFQKPLESSSLKRAFDSFNSFVQSPFRRTGNVASSTKSSYRKPILSASTRLIVAPRLLRFRLFLGDVSGLFFVATILCVLMAPFTVNVGELVDVIELGELYGLIPIVTTFLQSLLVAPIIFGLMNSKRHGTSISAKKLSLKVVSTLGLQPSSLQLKVRALVSPLSILLSPIFFFISEKSLSDYSSGTMVIRLK